MRRYIEILITPGFSNRESCVTSLRARLRLWFPFGKNQIIFYVLTEGIKNVYDHANSSGHIILILYGNQLSFSIRDYNPEPVDLDAIIKKGTTSKPETGYNFGNGICGASWLSKIPRSQPRMLKYEIDSTAGLHYEGVWRVSF